MGGRVGQCTVHSTAQQGMALHDRCLYGGSQLLRSYSLPLEVLVFPFYLCNLTSFTWP